MSILGTIGKAALGAVKGGLGGGTKGILGGAIDGATGGSPIDKVVGAIRGKGGNLTTGEGNPPGVMNLSGGGQMDTTVIKKRRSLSGGRSLSGR